MRALLRRLFAQALADLDVATVMAPAVADLGAAVQRGLGLLVLAYGKAARAMARAVRDGLPGASLRGLVVVPATDAAPLPPFEVMAGGHPIPDEGSLRAGAAALSLAASARADELVVFLASGGGSALLELPLDPAVPLAEVQALHRALLACGADIVAINAVRQQSSAVKGGRLALAAAGAAGHTTVEIRDVPFRPGAVVASGPSLPPTACPAECRAVLDRYGLWTAVPALLRARLQADAGPPPPWPPLPRASTTVCSERHARAALARHARAAGCLVVEDDATDDWPYARAAAHLLRRLERLRRRHAGRAVAVLASGELSVPLPCTPGTGGRNQQFALHCARLIRGRPIAVLSAGTDGIDGSSLAAGAVVDGTTMARARRRGLDVHAHLARCDAHPLLHALGDTLCTGPTGTNVRDLRLCLHA